jgi:hypothetical protein
MLTKKTYVAVVNRIEQFRQKNFILDRKEHPNLAPCDYECALICIIQDEARKNHERVTETQAKDTLKYLVTKGILIAYLGGFTFPTDEKLPTREEVIEQTLSFLQKEGMLNESSSNR